MVQLNPSGYPFDMDLTQVGSNLATQKGKLTGRKVDGTVDGTVFYLQHTPAGETLLTT